jgi:peptidoglycan/LPS O-acetylase OafA/YrhL
VILSQKDAIHLVLLFAGFVLLGGAAVAVVAVLYAPMPDVLAALAGLVLGTAATVYLCSHPDLGQWAYRRKRAGRKVPNVGDWSYLQLKLAVAVVWLASAATAVAVEVL